MTKRYFAVLMVMMLLFAGSASVGAEASKPPKLVSAKAVQDIAKADTRIRFLSLSPDGAQIAWMDTEGKQICLLTIADAANKCFPFAENFGHVGRYSSMAWSPDGRYIVTNETFFDQLVDSDIWVFDTTTGLFSDRTDDAYFGSAMKLPETAFADYLPTWNPVTGDLYIFRTPSKASTPNGHETNFYLLPVDEGEPTLLQQLSVRLPTLSVYRPVSISPDGKMMAFLVLPNDYFENALTGVWVMNLEDKRFKQVVGLSDLQGGQPKQAQGRKDSLLIPNNIGWAGNDGIVVSSKDVQMSGLNPQNSYYVDVATGQTTPLIDFTGLESQADYFKIPSDGTLAPKAKSPQAGVVTPDGTGYIYLSTDVEPTKAYVWWKALPPTDEEPSLIGTIDDFKITGAADGEPSISQDGKEAVLFGYLLTLGG
jgi:WD40 repeat protein